MQVSQNLKTVCRGRVFRRRGVQSIPSTSKKKYYLLSEAQLKKLHDDDTEMLACLDECDRYIDQIQSALDSDLRATTGITIVRKNSEKSERH